MNYIVEVTGTPYSYSKEITSKLRELANRVSTLRTVGSLNPNVLYRLSKYFRLKNIYHSNAIEGNQLDIGETRLVVEQGITITGKSLKDQAEARNLGEAIDFIEDLINDYNEPITELDIRQVHGLILKGIDDINAGGYRTVQVEISGSNYKPPQPIKIQDNMADMVMWLSKSGCPDNGFATKEGLITAAIAHTWLVYIHPFIDGNGRVARLLMNLLLMRYGFPIAIITREDRLRYYDALEQSQSSDLTPFLQLLMECVEESLEEYEKAVEEQREHEEWARSLASKFSERELIKVKNQYEVWKNAMELFRSYMHQTAVLLDESSLLARVYYKEFGIIEFDKYLPLRIGESAKRTWFFKIDFHQGNRSKRFLFFFGFRSPILIDLCDVTLHIAHEYPPGSFSYERTFILSRTIPSIVVPSLVEVGYNASQESFIAHYINDTKRAAKIEDFGRSFFEEVITKYFTR